MLAHREGIGGRVLPREPLVGAHALAHIVEVVEHLRVDRVDHVVGTGGTGGHQVTELALELEVLDRLQLGEDAGLQGVAGALLETAGGVVVIRERVRGTGAAGIEVPALGRACFLVVESGNVALLVIGVGGQERSRAQDVVHGVPVDVHVVGDTAVGAVVEVQRLADAENIELVVLDHDVVGVHTEGVALELGVDRIDLVVADDTVLSGVGQTDGVLVVRRAAGHVDRMVGRHGTLVIGFFHPVGALPGAALDLLVQVGRQDARPVGQGDTFVLVHQVEGLHILLRVAEVRHLGDELPAVVAVVGHHGAAFLTLLGGHEHDAVRSTGTVDGGRCSILEHVDGLDVSGVEGAEATACHTVDDVERVGIADSTHTADVDLVAFARLAGGLSDGNARALALESAQDGGCAEFRQVTTLHLYGGTGDEFLLLHTVTDDDRLGKLVQIGIERNVQGVLAIHGDFRRDVAEAFHGKHGGRRCFDGEVAVRVGGAPGARTLDNDGRERDRVAAGAIGDRSLDRQVLGIDSQCGQSRQEEQKDFVGFHKVIWIK